MIVSRCSIAIALASTIACGGSRPSPPPPGGSLSCTLVPAPATPADLITGVFTSTVDERHAPNPTTAAERFLFAHTYEPLLRVDCGSSVTRGLARSWTPFDGNTRWRIVLRSDARFWNGARVTASDVIASWQATGQAPTAVLARHLVAISTVVDDTTLDVRLGSMAIDALGDRELAVAKRLPQTRWPEGTGRYRIQDVAERRSAAPQRSTFFLEPVAAERTPRIAVHTTTESDARDLVDGGAQLIVTEDRALSAYRTTRPGVVSTLLTSGQTWLLVTHVPLTGDSAATIDPNRTADLRAALAHDVVRAQARPASSARWLPLTDRCEPVGPTQPVSRGSRATMRVVYRRDEPVARALAERLVALSASGDGQLALTAPELARAGARATAAGLAPNEFDAALRSGIELAYVVPIRRTPIPSCDASETLVALAPWLAGAPGTAHFSGIVAPLIESQPVAVIIGTPASFTLTGDGTVLVSQPRTAP